MTSSHIDSRSASAEPGSPQPDAEKPAAEEPPQPEAGQEQAKMIELLRQNTELTELIRDLSQRIEKLTVEMHGRVVPG